MLRYIWFVCILNTTANTLPPYIYIHKPTGGNSNLNIVVCTLYMNGWLPQLAQTRKNTKYVVFLRRTLRRTLWRDTNLFRRKNRLHKLCRVTNCVAAVICILCIYLDIRIFARSSVHTQRTVHIYILHIHPFFSFMTHFVTDFVTCQKKKYDGWGSHPMTSKKWIKT